MAVLKEFISVVLVIIFLKTTQADEYFVHPFPCHPGVPCQTLEDYVSDATSYFRSNSTFVFLENKHCLTVRLNLANLTNVLFKGTGDTEIIISPSAGFFFAYSSDITFQSLLITNTGEDNDVFNVALGFNYSGSLLLSSVHFQHVNRGMSRSHAVEFFCSTVIMTNCSFTNGFLINGGAVYALDSDLSFNGETHFENNTADFSGGAIYANNSILSFRGSTYFKRNRAGAKYFPSDYDIGGGGIFAWQTAINFEGNTEFIDNGPIHFFNNVLIGAAILAVQDSNLMIEGNSLFRKNSGYMAGAILLVNSIGHISGISSYVGNNATMRSGGGVFVYRSKLYCNGSIQFTANYAIERGGGIYLEHSILRSEKIITFSQNRVESHGGGGVALLHSEMEISGTVNFVENQGRYGGALELQGTSQMELNYPVSVNFVRNRARTGGAILIADSLSTYATQCQNLSIERMNCFYKVQTPKPLFEGIRLNFTENFVNYSGASIYGGTLELCRIQVNGNQSSMNGYEFFQNVSDIKRLSNSSSDVSSKPLKVCPCVNGVSFCSNTELFLYRNIVPGRTFNIEVMATGQLNMPEPANIVDIFRSINMSKIQPQPSNSNSATTCHNIGYKIFTRNSVENLQIYPEGCNSYNASLFLTLTVDQCPPGFQLVDDGCQCEQALKTIIKDESSCDIETGLIKLPSAIWIQQTYVNESYIGFYYSQNCGTPYCQEFNSTNPIRLNFSSPEKDIVCKPNRTGVACGSCISQYSLVMHQQNCELCEDRYLSLIILFIFAGIALVCILFLLKMTVANGTINGLILYCNFVNICNTFFFPLDQASVTPLSLFIAWINLDFGIPSCFYNGMDAYSYTWLQFVFPFYLWLLIGGIIITCKLSSRVGNLFGSNPVAVLATIVLLSFTKLLDTVVNVLSYRIVYKPGGSRELRWWSDSNLGFFDKKHTYLAIFSIFVIAVFLVPYIFLVTFGYRLLKFSGKKGFRWFNNFKPLLDAYYAPFTHNGRYWLGFTLFLRSSLFISFIIPALNNNNGTLVVATSLFAAVATLGWISGRIYEQFYVEVLEASFILNICILSVASYHINLLKGNQLHVTNISVAVAFVLFIGILISHVLHRIAATSCFKKIRLQHLKGFEKHVKVVMTRDHKSQPEENTAMAITEPQEQMTIAIREPLLDDSTIM